MHKASDASIDVNSRNSAFNDYTSEYLRSIEDPDDFWGEVAARMVHWDKPFETVLDNSNSPYTKWYSGGYLNACYNAIDRHVIDGHGEKVAIIHDSPLTNTLRRVTYQELYDKVSAFYGAPAVIRN